MRKKGSDCWREPLRRMQECGIPRRLGIRQAVPPGIEERKKKRTGFQSSNRIQVGYRDKSQKEQIINKLWRQEVVLCFNTFLTL